jgi:hypothetical protein
MERLKIQPIKDSKSAKLKTNDLIKQQIIPEHGYSCDQLISLGETLESHGMDVEWFDLGAHWNEGHANETMEAGVLVIRKGVQHILKTCDTQDLWDEHNSIIPDKHAKMRGRVVQKRARWNLCFDDHDQTPDFDHGKGTIVSWNHIPLTLSIRNQIQEWTQDDDLKGESNVYYNPDTCGIGYHGDGERKKVFAARFGATEKIPLYFQWFKKSAPVGERIPIHFNDGDMYVMSEKAVGFDWLKKNIPTIRHAAGCDKYTVIKQKKSKHP